MTGVRVAWCQAHRALWRPLMPRSKVFLHTADVMDNERLLDSLPSLQKKLYFPRLHAARGKRHAPAPRCSRQQECVTKCVRAGCLIGRRASSLSDITTGNDRPFALKSRQSFSLFPHYLWRAEATDPTRPNPPLRCPHHLLRDSASPRTAGAKTPVRMQNKHLLA